MIQWLKALFKRRAKPPDTVCIHHSFFRGWPRAPNIQLQTFPIIVKISMTMRPTRLPIDVVEYTYLESDTIAGLQRATYLLTEPKQHSNLPDFVWVFLTD